jgi:hypothetical protein
MFLRCHAKREPSRRRHIQVRSLTGASSYVIAPARRVPLNLCPTLITNIYNVCILVIHKLWLGFNGTPWILLHALTNTTLCACPPLPTLPNTRLLLLDFDWGADMLFGWVPKESTLARPLQAATFVGGRVWYGMGSGSAVTTQRSRVGPGMAWYWERSDHATEWTQRGNRA